MVISNKIKCRLYLSFHNMPFNRKNILKILWADVLPGLRLASISFQTVPMSPVSICWFFTSVLLFAINDNFFSFCPGCEYLFIIFNSDLVVNSFQLLKFLVHRTLNSPLLGPFFFSYNFFFLSLDIFRVNIYKYMYELWFWQGYGRNSCYYLLLLILFIIWSWDSLFFVLIAFILRLTNTFCRTVKMSAHGRQGRI